MKEFMNPLLVFITTLCLLTTSCTSFAQNIGVNTTGTLPNKSALLDLSATDNGFLITGAEPISINSPVFGLLTLAPSDSCLYMYSGED